MDDWSNVGGCTLKHLRDLEARAECEAAWYTKQGIKQDVAQSSAEADLLLAQAALTTAQKTEKSTWGPLATTMVVVGSLAAIAGLIIVVKKVKK